MSPGPPLQGGTLWLTGLSGAGKSTLTQALLVALQISTEPTGRWPMVLDGDEVRADMNRDLGFGEADRREHVRRCGALARMLAAQGHVVLVSLISPYRDQREAIAQAHRHDGSGWCEVHVNTPLALCEQADPKGLYRRARAGLLRDVVGLDVPYEPPLQALCVSPYTLPLSDCVEAIISAWARESGHCLGRRDSTPAEPKCS